MQNWLNPLGLGFDFVGVLILAWEWWLALSADQREAAITEQQMRFRPHPMTPPLAGEHQAVFDRMREDMRFRQMMERGHMTRSLRRAWFLTAFALMAVGFILQFLGSWPGGVPGLGI